jgi:iron complex transport system substrate-binding protein
VTDFLGREITLSQPAQSFVSLAPGNTEILFALGLGPQVVGVTSYDDYPPEVREIEPVGGMVDPDLEKIVALAPDLVLVTGIHQKNGVIASLEEHGLKTLALDPTSIEGILRGISLVARLSGREETGAQVIQILRERIKQVEATVAQAKERPRVFFVVWHEPLWTTGRGTFIHDLIETAGGNNIFSDITDFQEVNLEQVLVRDPEVIIANTGHGSAKKLPWRWANEEPRLESTTARRHGRVYLVDANLVNRPGPRIVLGLETLARFIHPELYPR